MIRRHLIRTFFGGILLAIPLAAGPSRAQVTYPDRPVRIVLPIPPGTALDVVTRVIAEQMAGSLGQPLVIENRPGAGGLLAAQAVAAAPADGYTLLGGAAAIFTILPAQKDQLPINVGRDFIHVGMVVGSGVMFIAVSPKLGVKSFSEFAALMKTKPGEIIIGTNGAGTLPHYAGLLLQRKGGLPFTLVPYNQGGTPAVVADIMGGRVHATIEAAFGLRGQLQSGDLQIIGAMSAEREPDFPSVPTVAETLPGLTAVGFMSLAAPANTPEAIVRRLNESLNQALATPAVKQRFAELGVPISIVSPAQATAFVERQRQIWLPLVKELDGR
ncbi:MAG: Bug family tripartite tricarboxylate transporter substrate binding protein [Beijerinckiaceae bacterium]